jgi:hypothetical protein
VSGAATGGQSYLLAQAFSSSRQERLEIRPSVNSGMLGISVLARSTAGAALAFGQTQVTLSASGAVSAQVVLTSQLPMGDLSLPGGGDGGVTGPSVRLLAGQLGGIGSFDATGAAARFNCPRGVVFAGGNLYVTDMYNQVIRQIVVATGQVTTLAGSPLVPGSDDGIGAAARFYRPHGITTDGKGNLFVADMRNDTIRQIVIATGQVTTLAGSAQKTGVTDDVGAAARFDHPHGIVYDGNGDLYVADTHNQTIRKIVIATGQVTTLAGTAGTRGSMDATGLAAQFYNPHDLAFDGGKLFVAGTHNYTVRQIDVATGVVTTLAGVTGSGGTSDGSSGARFNAPRGLVSDGAGNLYVADTGNNSVRRIVESTGQVTTLAGHDYGSNDGTGAGASFAGPMALATDGAGNLFIADGFGQTIRALAISKAAVTTLAGDSPKDGHADGVGGQASFGRPHGLCTDGNAIYVADKDNHTIRKIDYPTGEVTTLAGNSQPGSGDGMGAGAQFDEPSACVADGAGNLFVADSSNATIREIALATGLVTTLAGAAGQEGSTTDVAGSAARFNKPFGLAYANGTLYVADADNDTLRAIDLATTQVSTLAGTAGSAGAMDGTGAGARFNEPVGLAIEGGVLYVSDQRNQTIRSVTLPGAVVGTLAGSAGVRGAVDGPGSTARFDMPQGLIGDGAGDLYVADTRNHTVRKIVIATTAVSTFAGTSGIGAVQLGPLPAVINTPTGIAIGPGGALVFTTTHENAVLVAR